MSMEGVKNSMEDLVELYIDTIMKEVSCCMCERCKKDVFALALNSLKPMYVVTRKGEALVKSNMLARQFKADVMAALIEACNKVKGEMRHE